MSSTDFKLLSKIKDISINNCDFIFNFIISVAGRPLEMLAAPLHVVIPNANKNQMTA